ncbi:S-adenosyl-L-methionine-dependent methyltransferase [Immersiella caudata]|uniref:S-adenosyl-L-methionine-dependent methyltransferase n=1 Tax=Immersiella caudata TaxID=314043 RepID=A0AA39WVG2_9PEZI|nr:S-adenosyl-L-methionine-dependent methyltransferase [Immersiella caudata]
MPTHQRSTSAVVSALPAPIPSPDTQVGYTSTQYNTFAPSYNHVRENPTLYIESSTLYTALKPYIQSSRILDLACGTGYFSRKLLTWGAESVLGVDISEEMIAVACGTLGMQERGNANKKLVFEVGDARVLGIRGKGGYDLITAVWLVNYARDKEEMREMFAGIAANLKEGGRFVGITLPPVEGKEMGRWKERMDGVRKGRVESWGVDMHYRERLENGGWEVVTDGGDGVCFVEFHLPRELFDIAAREAGLKGVVEWREVSLDEGGCEEVEKLAGREFCRQYFEGSSSQDLDSLGPHFGLLVVEK